MMCLKFLRYIFLTISFAFFINAIPSHLKPKPLGNDIVLSAKTGRGIASLPNEKHEKWPNGIVPYIIDEQSGYEQSEIDIILEGMRTIEEQTSSNGIACITFVPRTDQIHYIKIHNGEGCSSLLGMQKDETMQLLSLARPDSNNLSCIYTGTVAHELIHALGFNHEQNRADRDNYIHVYYENINPNETAQFEKELVGYDYLNESYDYESIMHYDSYSFSINGNVTMLPLQQNVTLIDPSDRKKISEIDVREIRKFYDCKEPITTKKRTTTLTTKKRRTTTTTKKRRTTTTTKKRRTTTTKKRHTKKTTKNC